MRKFLNRFFKKKTSDAIAIEAESKEIVNETLNVPPSIYQKNSLLGTDADVLLRVGSFLNQTDYSKTKQALRPLLREDKETKKPLLHNASAFHKISEAGKLLRATEYADYDQVEHLIANDPSLQFEPVSFKFRDGHEERISPLSYAFKFYDTYMWKTVFLKTIEELEDAVKREKYLKKFYEQMQAQAIKGQTTLVDLTNAYETLQRQTEALLQTEMSDQDIQNFDTEWYAFGKRQKELLPIHMLKEFLRKESQTWNLGFSFDVEDMPRPSIFKLDDYTNSNLQMFGVRELDNNSLPNFLCDPNWGVSFSLVRGPYPNVGCWGGILSALIGQGHGEAPLDLQIFNHLFDKRKEEFDNHLKNNYENVKQDDQRLEVLNRLA